ncbi:MAG: UDP-N-acetylglucosamine 1-carboxyvinyltransferase [Candidatus Margulisiibacteriota bacterium]|jgi:UDP-N-acetylglucosamine 1-carboxyvinyltransferase
MSKVAINGGKPLSGTVTISGAKNAALPIMAAMLMLPGENTICNVPNLADVVTMVRMLRSLGLGAEYIEPHTVKTWRKTNLRHVAPYDLVTKMRASFFVAGPLIAVTGSAKIPLPGGCAIGTRPIDLHLKGFQALGAKYSIQHGFVEIKAEKLVGNKVYLDYPSVGATENIIMAACFAEGHTTIENAAREPEIEDLINFLNQAGGKISGGGSNIIEVDGVSSLKSITNYPIIPDRIEAGTMILAGAITKGNVILERVIPRHFEGLLGKLKEAGIQLEIGADTVSLTSNGGFNSVDIETLPYPGFPTDMQAQIMALLALAKGTSVITETVFENRFSHAQELKRMGANIRISERNAIIHGVNKLSGAPVKITDLRAGAALILAGLAAEGETTVYGMNHIYRGYEHLVDKLNSLGADIRDLG